MAKSFRNCEIVLYPESTKAEDLKKYLQWQCIEKYAYILHDKDLKENGEKKKAHWHICLKFSSPTHLAYICKAFGDISENCVERIKGRWVDVLKYLTHGNAEEKYQYSIDEVVANFDVEAEIEASQRQSNINAIIEKICNGDIRKYNCSLEGSPSYIDGLTYSKHRRLIDNAFAYYEMKISQEERDMECIYVYGEPGKGKTTYAKEMAKNMHMNCYISGGSNDPLDGYKGEPVIILDDLRASAFELCDLLKLLDNNTASQVKSRYANKAVNACKFMIVTTTRDINTFFASLSSITEEDKKQLLRRCKTLVHMTDKKIYYSFWSDDKQVYRPGRAIDNFILEKIEKLKPAAVLDRVSQCLGLSSDIVKMLKEDINAAERDAVAKEKNEQLKKEIEAREAAEAKKDWTKEQQKIEEPYEDLDSDELPL